VAFEFHYFEFKGNTNGDVTGPFTHPGFVASEFLCPSIQKSHEAMRCGSVSIDRILVSLIAA
jgi:hypothetical protein